VKALLLLLLCAGLAPAWAVAPEMLAPRDFAYGFPIVTTEDAAAYRVEVPLDVYRGTVDPALADIRVFNSRGETVPYAIKRRDLGPPLRSAAISLPVFPLRSTSRIVIDGVRVTIDASQSVNLETRRGASNQGVTEYVIESLDTPIAALELKWPESSTEFSGRLRVDASDDLNVWRIVAASAPIANLHANGQELIERRIELPPTQAKYWRLTWMGSAPPFEINEVWAQKPDHPAEAPSVDLVVPGVPDPRIPNAYLFDLQGHLPVERINLKLPEENTVSVVDLDSRDRPEHPFRPLARAGFYRLKGANGEQSNAAITIDIDHDRYWRARIVGPGGPMYQGLALKVSWIPDEIIFLARGSGPYLLAYGAPAAPAAETDLAAVPSTIPIVHASLGTLEVLGGSIRTVAVAEPFWSKQKILWAILVLGVGVLASMAYALARESRSGPGDENEGSP
jgi:hypothetical protein